MSDAPPHSPRPRRRRIAVPIALAVSVVLIVVGDRALRARQRLLAHLAGGDLHVIVPFAEPLREGVTRKTTWNDLHERIARARAAKDDKRFFDNSYELAKFMEAELGLDDPRRRQVLLDVIAYAPDAPESVNAYWALLDPAWQGELRGQYPRYGQAITAHAKSAGDDRLLELGRLAAQMRLLGEPQLELQALRDLRASTRVSMHTETPLRRLLEVLPVQDPAREPLAAELAAFDLHREELRAAARWYDQFERGRGKATLEELERLRKAAPDLPASPFLLSADTRLISAYLREGRFADAQRMRARLASAPISDLEEAAMVAAELAQEGIDPQKPPNKPPTGTPPDDAAITFHRWRGLLQSGRVDEANRLVEDLAGKDRTVQTAAAEERALLAGDLAKVTPHVRLQSRTDGLPPELAGATGASYARLDLQPAGKAVPAEVKAWVELWLTEYKLLIVARAEEPRAMRSPTTRPRDADINRDEHFEFVFNPDRWFDYQYVIAVNRAGALADGVVNNTGSVQRRQHRLDRSFNLDVDVKVEQDAKGWTQRIVLPRQRVFPAGNPAVRFNARRTRWVVESGQSIAQNYTWSPKAPAGEQRPEHLGWLVGGER